MSEQQQQQQQPSGDTPQPLSFSDFLERMKEPAAADLVRVIKSFIKEFEDRAAGGQHDPAADSDRVQAFLEQAERLFRGHPVWRGSPPEVLDQAMEGLEKYVMSKVWRQVFGSWVEDAERDERYARLAQALAFVDLPALLGGPCPPPDAELLGLATGEVLRMDRYKAPRDKLLCLVNVKTMVEDVVAAADVASAAAGGPRLGGADAFFPVLLLAVVRARPPRLASNIEYLKRFRMRSRLTGQFDYMLANLESVALYLDTVNYEHLRISQADFLAHLAAAGIPEAHRELRDLQAAQDRAQAQAVRAAQEMEAQQAQQSDGAARDGDAAAAAGGGSGQDGEPGAAAAAAAVAAAPPQEQPRPAVTVAAVPFDLLSMTPEAVPAPGSGAAAALSNEAAAAPGPPIEADAAAAALPTPELGTPPASPLPSAGSELGLTPLNTGPTPGLLEPAAPPAAEFSEDGFPGYSAPARALDYGGAEAEETAPRRPSTSAAGSPGGRRALFEDLVREGLGSVLSAEACGELASRYPYMYAEAEDLSVEDVRRVLLAYKELILRVEGLQRGLAQQWGGEQRREAEGGQEPAPPPGSPTPPEPSQPPPPPQQQEQPRDAALPLMGSAPNWAPPQESLI